MKHYGGDPFSTERLSEEVSKVNCQGIKWDDLKIVQNELEGVQR